MIDTEEYRLAIAGEGPLAYEWSDKPHRLVYDLAAEVDRLRTQVAAVEASIPEWPLCGYRCAEEIEERVRAALASGDEVRA